MDKPADVKRRKLMLGLAGVVTLVAGRDGIASETQADSIEQPERSDDATFIARAFGMQRRAIDSGDQAYGAVVVRNGRIVGQSPSRVVINRDPTAHAEMEAIRDAARRLGSRDLSRCTLYSSSPACPMCEAAAYWAGIERMVYGKNASEGGGPRLCG
ncbi:MAG: nucleoside deaminase [Gammaproteobacteria bacterium]|nr:nucleoside deaminase [Gammaproteobacteria bacterium]MDH3858827.1 nucleoside deaminase [Gammaproteobacteria bacterium]